MCCKSKRKLRKINDLVLFIAYFPLLITAAASHIIMQALFLPPFLFKLLRHAFFEILNTTVQIGQKPTTFWQRFKKSLLCFLYLIISPLIIPYCLLFDSIIYLRCLFLSDTTGFSSIEEEELITPFIMNKINEIFDRKYNYIKAGKLEKVRETKEIPVEQVIDDFTEHMKMANHKYDFNNVLLGAYHRESVFLVKEYSVFVKFVNKLRIKNEYNEEIINKSLLINLIESNVNFCRLLTDYNHKKKGIKANSRNSTKVYPNEKVNDNSKNGVSMSMSQWRQNNSHDSGDEEDEEDLFDLQAELGKNERSRRSIVALSSLPKIFYKRLYMINLQDIKNSLDSLKNKDSAQENNQKIKTELKIIRKTLVNISSALNLKETIEKQRKSNIINRNQRKSMLYPMNFHQQPSMSLISENPRSSIIAPTGGFE
jgi:hypothetical protein